MEVLEFSNLAASRWRVGVITLMTSFSLIAAAAAMPTDQWIPSSPAQQADLKTSGTILSSEGAEVAVVCPHSQGRPVGAMTSIDSAPLAKHEVTLSADVTVSAGSGDAELWVRADSADGTKEFTNSWQVDGGSRKDASKRKVEVKMDVPSRASRLVIGVAFRGQGAVQFERVRLLMGREVATSPTPTAVLDEGLKIIETHSLHADRVDWTQVSLEAHQAAAKAEIAVDVYPIIRHTLTLLGDRHSSLSNSYQAKALSASGRSPDDVEIRHIGDGVMYLNMPAYRGNDGRAAAIFAETVSTRILAEKSVRGWIIDLRGNSGGNMWPMLSALSPLLGKGQVGSFVAHGTAKPWFAVDPSLKSSADETALTDIPVAVLIGPATASSGEIVAVAFHGRPRTSLFGMRTAGFSTSNTDYRLADGSLLHLTTSVDADRNGVLFEDGVMPDQVIDHDSGEDLESAASAWVLQNQVTQSSTRLQ